MDVILLLYSYEAIAVKLPGPLVYVVTPSSKPRIDEGRSAPKPFYYHNWMRRMDAPSNASTTTTTTTAAPKKVMTPDLIFAEFEADKMKNIRKLLEKERIDRKTTTTTTTITMKPIYVPNDEPESEEAQNVNYGLPSQKEEVKTNEKDMTDYFALYNNMYDVNNAPPAPKDEEYSGKWDEVPIGTDSEKDEEPQNNQSEEEHQEVEHEEKPEINEDFALPGFGTNPGSGGENESRAIRTEPNIRFPYVNLKPFQMKNLKKPLLNALSNSKKGNNMFNLDSFKEVRKPVRGEAQEVPMPEPIDRYNPAQPYLPLYGGVKPQNTGFTPTKAVANLVPPPPPPPPKVTDNDFPAPNSYEPFPPFETSDNAPPAPPAPAPRPSVQTIDTDDSDVGPGDDGPVMDLGYRYKPPSAPTQNFLPTLPPLQKPAGGYSYDKPPMSSYDAPPPSAEAPPMDSDFQGYNYDKPPTMPSKPDFSGYHYKKPEAPAPAAPSPSYGHDYPELIFDKPHGGHGPKGGHDMKGGADSMGMVPPPVHDVMPGPADDSGFPQDFPGDFKYSHDFDDHDFHHHHHEHHEHHPTTTETPRVNRFSYYYLGKKLYYLPLYFSVYFIVYVGALIIKAVLRHKIVYPNSWRPNDQTATFFTKRSADSLEPEWASSEKLHEITGRVTRAIATAAERYMESKKDKQD
ncbi:actin cytoskeleton-regulatory complex protein PAN1 [Phthorimaea operculella]|nr:actin cytoskeleton-regulatory complex protein PAN1 [Phthorimaea operculella]